MQSRGARIDLSPQSLIALKQQGVSDRVVMAAQNLSGGRGYVAGAPPVAIVREMPATRVYVAPAPCYYDRWHYWDYHHHHYHPRSHVHVGVGF